MNEETLLRIAAYLENIPPERFYPIPKEHIQALFNEVMSARNRKGSDENTHG